MRGRVKVPFDVVSMPGGFTVVGRGGARTLAVLFVAAAVGVLGAGGAEAALDGTPDATWQTDGRVRAVTYAHGVVYLGGSFTHVSPPGGGTSAVRNHVAAFDADTGNLLPWNPNADEAVSALAVDGSTVYLGGRFGTVGGKQRAHVAAVKLNGDVTSWNPGANGPVNAIARDASGGVYLGGSFTTVDGKHRLRVAQVGPGGSVTGWNPSVSETSGTCPPSCTPIVFSLKLSRNKSALYIGGRFDLVNGTVRKSAAAVSTDSGALLQWNPVVVSPHPKKPAQVGRVLDMALSPSRVYLCGDFWSVGGVVSANLASVDPVTGNRDSAFNANTDGGSPACRVRDGLLIIGGHFIRAGSTKGWVHPAPGVKSTLTGAGTVKRIHLAAFALGNGAIANWNPGANSTLGVHAMATRSKGLAVGGDFTVIGGRHQEGFAQFSD
jgi:trimeric autotransporter adhesin